MDDDDDDNERSFWNCIGWIECIPTPELILMEVDELLGPLPPPPAPIPVLFDIDPSPPPPPPVEDVLSEHDTIEPVCGSNICIDELVEVEDDDDDDCRIDGDLLVVIIHTCSVVLYLLLLMVEW